LKILTIGNSASLDACHLLNLIAATEGFEEELYIGTLYHSGCTLNRHVENLALDRADYSLHISSSKTPDLPPANVTTTLFTHAVACVTVMPTTAKE